MPLKNFATFEADFPDDAQWDEGENLIVPGGRNVATFLRASLESKGFECSNVQQHSFYGWLFEVHSGSVRIWCLLQYPGRWLLLIKARGSILDWLLRRNHEEHHRRVLEAIGETLSNSDRFGPVRWYTKNEYERFERA